MKLSKEKANFGHKVIIEYDAKGNAIAFHDLYALSSDEYTTLKQEVNKYNSELEEEKEKQARLQEAQELKEKQEQEEKEKQEQEEQEYNNKYSKTNFLNCINQILIGQTFGWYSIDKATYKSLILSVLNEELTVEEAVNSNEVLKNLFTLITK